MPSLDELLQSSQTEKLGHLMHEPETQKLFSMLSKTTNGTLEQAAGNAAKGDTTQLISAIKQLMQNPEAAQLIEQMKQKMK